MELTLARQRVEHARVAHLGTTMSNGRPHLVPCCFALRGEVVYTAIDAKPKASLAVQRMKNIEASPAACLIVDHYQEDWSALWWVRLDALGRVADSSAETEQAMRALQAKYAQYHHVPIPGPVIALDIMRWTTWP
jgi:PPOX class probable F420-dependent enzyme